jgi:hypothetical protein
VKDADVAALRRVFTQKPSLKAADVEALFHIQDACPVQDPVWALFFIDTVTDYLVRELEPSGYLTHAQGAWLIARISVDRRVRTKTEFDLLVNVLDKSRWAPASLASFALAQVRDAVLTGTGPLRVGSVLKSGRITPAEVAGVRSILCAYGAEGTMAITRGEVEVLFAINDAVCSAGASHPADDSGWSELFVRAIAGTVMAASGYAVPSREEMLQHEPQGRATAALPGSESTPGAYGQLPIGMLGSYRTQSPEERALARLERQRVEIITGEPVREVDAQWLAERLGNGQQLGRNEHVLLAALKHAGTTLAPALQAAVDRHCRAA